MNPDPKLLDLEQDLEQLSQYNDGVKRGIELFRGAYRSLASKFPKLSISFVYAAMSAVQSPHENTQKKMDDLVRLLESLFDEAKVSGQFAGAKELLATARKRPNQTFKLSVSKSIPSDASYIALTTLTDYDKFLRNDTSEVRQDLFESNVRDFQGSTEVNKEIQNSLASQASIDFWWLNNGVTILASASSLAGNVLTIENPQIVNGLQTSSQIAMFFDGGGTDNGRLLLVKVISSEDEETRDNIIKATNSQNSVPPASLRATDKVQRDIEHSLKSGGYFYDRRKNYYKNQGKPAAKIISIPLLAQAVMTLFRKEPDNARARPSSLIKSNEVYASLFSESYPVDAYLVAADLTRRIELALKNRGNIEAKDRNNLRFYCVLYAAFMAAQTVSLSPHKVSKLKDKIGDASIEAAIDTVRKLFNDHGGTDQFAKGPKFKNEVIQKAKKKIKKMKVAGASDS